MGYSLLCFTLCVCSDLIISKEICGVAEKMDDNIVNGSGDAMHADEGDLVNLIPALPSPVRNSLNDEDMSEEGTPSTVSNVGRGDISFIDGHDGASDGDERNGLPTRSVPGESDHSDRSGSEASTITQPDNLITDKDGNTTHGSNLAVTNNQEIADLCITDNAQPTSNVYTSSPDMCLHSLERGTMVAPLGPEPYLNAFCLATNTTDDHADVPPPRTCDTAEQGRDVEPLRAESECNNANLGATYTCSDPSHSQLHEDSNRAQVNTGNASEGAHTRGLPPAPIDFPSINITIQCGDFSAIFDIADIVKMASRPRHDLDVPDDELQAAARRSVDCRGCEHRMNAQDRRMDDFENAVTEQLRRMHVQREMPPSGVDASRGVSDRTDRLDTVAQPNPPSKDRSRREVAGQAAQTFVNPDRRGRNIVDYNPRSRAATFAGHTSRPSSRNRSEAAPNDSRQVPVNDKGDYGARPKTRSQRKPPSDDGDVDIMAPKPQRQKGKGKRGQPIKTNFITEDRTRAAENPIRDWLSSARKSVQGPDTTPAPSRRPRATEPSPSWADDPLLDDDEADTSESLTPPPATSRDRPSMSPASAATLVSDGRSSRSSDDDEIPPSGKVTQRGGRRAYGAANGGGQNGAQGGAKPKTRGKKPEVVNANNYANAKGNGKSNASRKPTTKKGTGDTSYANVAANTKWKTVQSKKRKFEKVSPKLTFPLKGKPATSNRDVYLQGLDVGNGNGEDDMLDSVKAFCISRGVTPLFVRIIPVKYDCTRVGCRLTVSEEDFERVIDEEFWPEDVSVREWTQRPRDNRGNDAPGPRPPSDNED